MAFDSIRVAALLLLTACSSDAAPEPEASVDTPGAFVAVDAGEEALRLYRTLDYLDLDQQRILFVTRYRPAPRDFDEARELSKDHALPVGIEFEYLGLADVEDLAHQVVWFRTLTEDEQERVP